MKPKIDCSRVFVVNQTDWLVRVLAGVFVVILLTGCTREDSRSDVKTDRSTSTTGGSSEPSSSTSRSAAITTERYSFVPGEHGPELRIRHTLHAPAGKAMYVVNCNGAVSTGLQALRDDVWVDSWAATTNQCLSEPIVIPPGKSHDATLLIGRGAGGMFGGEGEVPPPGTYRVIWYGVLESFDGSTYPFGTDFPEEQRVSGPITIEPSPTN